MNKDLNIQVDAKHVVYGRFSGSLTQPLLIIIHGLPCNIEESLYLEAANWFEKQGYAVYRFNLYSYQADARQLIDSTLTSHAADLDTVVNYFRQHKVKKIYVAGHSFGAPTILTSPKQNFDTAILWDGSYDISFAKEKYGYPGGKFIKELNGYLMHWGPNVIINKVMAEEVDNLPWDKLATNFKKPLSIIAAGKGILVKGAKTYFATANSPKKLTIIKGATHHFADSSKVRLELFKATKQWIDQF